LGEERVCLGQVVGVHGVKGLVRVRSFTEDPEAVAAYGALQDDRGGKLILHAVGRAKGLVLVRVDGVTDRTEAESLKGTRLYIERAALPAITETEAYYHADLIGLAAETASGEVLGRVTAVHDFGAGDLLEIQAEPGAGRRAGESVLVPFTRAAVPEVDLAGGRVVVRPAETADGTEMAERAGEETGEETGDGR